MNEEAHQLAKSVLVTTQHQFSDIAPPSSLITLKSCYSLTSKWHATLQEQAHADSLHQTIYKNSKWSEDQFNMVDWAAFKYFLHCLSWGRQISYCKLLHGIHNTNAQNKKFYNQPGLCPHCQLHQESFCHMMTCQHSVVAQHQNARKPCGRHYLVCAHPL
jgi:hypothetical protein